MLDENRRVYLNRDGNGLNWNGAKVIGVLLRHWKSSVMIGKVILVISNDQEW